jgi:hypothetical protein
MSFGTAVLILGVLCLLVFSAGFRRFALWASAVAVAELICGFFYWAARRAGAPRSTMRCAGRAGNCAIFAGPSGACGSAAPTRRLAACSPPP